jgi:hypothetical protein
MTSLIGKTKMRRIPLAVMAATALLGLAGCHKARPATGVSVTGAWARLPAVSGQAGAGYFTAKSAADDILLGASTPGARIEMHETMSISGSAAMGAMTGMRPVASVALPAGEAIRFAPGGKHLMIFGLDPKLKKGDTIRLAFRFRKAPPVTASAQLVGPADPPPANAGD